PVDLLVVRRVHGRGTAHGLYAVDPPVVVVPWDSARHSFFTDSSVPAWPLRCTWMKAPVTHVSARFAWSQRLLFGRSIYPCCCGGRRRRRSAQRHASSQATK